MQNFQKITFSTKNQSKPLANTQNNMKTSKNTHLSYKPPSNTHTHTLIIHFLLSLLHRFYMGHMFTSSFRTVRDRQLVPKRKKFLWAQAMFIDNKISNIFRHFPDFHEKCKIFKNWHFPPKITQNHFLTLKITYKLRKTPICHKYLHATHTHS